MGEAVDMDTALPATTITPMEVDTTCCGALAKPESTSVLPQNFWRLPPEIRNQIYDELLVTDCAFRLGHHGPYSHEQRKGLHPAILRTSKQACQEAIAILYGTNTFFLGPVGFKPTYSASFLTSIGPHNALRIRTVVAHCIHPHILSQQYLHRWFANLGLDTTSLKMVAISFSASEESKHLNSHHGRVPSSVPSIPTQLLPGTNLPVLGSQWPTTTTPSGSNGGSGGANTSTLLHGNPQPHVAPNLYMNPNAPINIGGPGQPMPPHTHQTTATATTAPTSHHLRVDSAQDDKPESEFDTAATKNRSWLEKRKRCEVDSLVALRNTDLRAGEDWLVYISPALKKRMGVKICPASRGQICFFCRWGRIPRRRGHRRWSTPLPTIAEEPEATLRSVSNSQHNLSPRNNWVERLFNSLQREFTWEDDSA